ncbi:MAG: hypothetical protein IPO90_12720 [Flavobacteriales bacterium]|nr:hypothetical protein [Flavobacteriales bacterium]
MPTQPQFKVSYTRRAAANAIGSLPVNGKFSYIEDNERKTEELPSNDAISGGTVAQESTVPDLSPVIQAPENPVALQPVLDNSNDVSSAGAGAPALNTTIVTPMAGISQQGRGGLLEHVRSIANDRD